MEKQPNGLVYAGNVAYSYKGQMPNNTSIELKEGTLSITSSIFYGCSELISVNIPNSVTKIGSYSFYYCPNLTTVIIGSGVTKIGAEAFSFCTSPLNVYCYAESIPFSSDGIFVGATKKSLHVPESLIKDYQNSNIWGGFSETVSLTDSDPKPGVSNSSNIKGIIINTNETKYYDLNGHMYNIPHKGLLIKNGKKYLNKNK